MSDFNEAMIGCNWDYSKYLEVAKKYGPTITGKTDVTTADVIAALEAMTGAPVDAVSMDDKPVSQFWAKELRKAMGATVKDDNNGSNSSTTVSEATLRQWEQEMAELINEERAKVGAPALEVNDDLTAFAQYWAEHLTTEFRHSAWSENEDFANKHGLKAENMGRNENITTAGTIKTITESPSSYAMELFMNSEGHRRT